MTSTPDKGSVTALPSKIRDSRSAARAGFTLLELLVAVAMVATILSMVYGSYFATSRSAEACEAAIALSQDTRKVLEQMAWQIRCSYAPASANSTDGVSSSTDASALLPDRDRALSEQRQLMPKDTICYFHGKQDGLSGEILHLVTTHPISWEDGSTNGLFDVTYRLDRMRGQLSFSQERFIGTTRGLVQARSWQPILTNVESIELVFFDGQRWLRKWDYKEKRRLPSAVRIGITCANEKYQQRTYSTVAHICCQANRGKRTVSDTLAYSDER
jgi:prepilin-type N-terminal cleavage/methylation domain-containing protein